VAENVGACALDDFYKLDFKIGAVFNELTGERVQVLPAILWKELRGRLAKEFRGEAQAINSEIGSILGCAFADQFMKHASDPQVLVERMAEVAAASGWGIFSTSGDTRYGSKFTVTVANCAFCEGESLADSPRCDFLVGVISGIAGRVFGTPHRVQETSCAASGECVCQVEVEETSGALETTRRSPFRM
jgi:predicted hydrocarbon binding protein